MTTKIASNCIQFILITTITALLAANVVPAYRVYQKKQTIVSDNPAGSSLAERYLILGDWPSSKNIRTVINQHDNFKINPQTNSDSHSKKIGISQKNNGLNKNEKTRDPK